MSAKTFFTPEQAAILQQAIAEAEQNTSGEIRIHVEDRCKGDSLLRAEKVFAALRMHKTELRNGVLFYLAEKDRAFAVCGDKGINERVPEGFWDEIKNKMQSEFSSGRFTEGLCEGIKMAGEKLKQYFPLKEGDKNELSNEVTFQ